MKILVTGGAGYIGSHLVDRLLARGDEVWVVDNLSTGRIQNIQDHLGSDRFHLFNDSILNEDLIDQVVAQVDQVYHLAAAVGVKHVVADPLTGVLTNVQGTEIVLKYAYKYWKRVLLASTSEIYGKRSTFPWKEDDDRVLGSTRVHRWSYSTSKAIDEHIAFAYSDKGLPISIVRYFNSYGPRIDERGYGSVVAQFARQALTGQPLTVHGEGQQSRCFTYVEDTVQGTLAAGEAPEALGWAFNIGTTEETTILDLAHKIVRMTESRSPITHISYDQAFGAGFEDTTRRLPCIDRAGELLRWQPRVSLEHGLRKTLDWCRANFNASTP